MWMISRICRWLDDFSRPPSSDVVVDDVEFSVLHRGKFVAAMRWVDIVKVAAFKRDWGMYDEICLAIENESAAVSILVSEEDRGYESFVKCLESQLPGFRAAWFADVAFPAFATNWTILFERHRVLPAVSRS